MICKPELVPGHVGLQNNVLKNNKKNISDNGNRNYNNRIQMPN